MHGRIPVVSANHFITKNPPVLQRPANPVPVTATGIPALQRFLLGQA